MLALVFVAFLFGVYQFATMPRRADPVVTIRACQVVTPWPGIDAERIERLITAPLEEVISNLPEVDFVKSTTTTGLSVIQVIALDELSSSEIAQTWDRVRTRVEIASASLPGGAGTPVVNDEFGQTAILQLAVFAVDELESDAISVYEPADLHVIADQIRDRLVIEPGVVRVELHGQQDEQIVIEVTPQEWAVSSVTIGDLENALSARSVQSTGGTLETAGSRLAVQVSGEFTIEDEIRSAVIGESSAGTPMTLDDLGLTVRRTYADPPAKIVRFGNARASADAIILSIVMEDGAKATELGPRLLQIVDAMQQRDKIIPPDIGVEIVFNEAGFVQRKITDFITNVVQAIVIVIAIALLLAGLRCALIMPAAIPFVMRISIGLSTFFGVQLERISIASLIISLGLLGDNAVVVTDNTRKHLDEGLGRQSAAIHGSNRSCSRHSLAHSPPSSHLCRLPLP